MKQFAAAFLALALLAALFGASLSSAPVQAAGTLTYTGEITPTNTADDYPISLAAGQTITIQLDCATGSLLDPIVEVYSSAMVWLDSNDDGGAPCINYNGSYLVFTAPATDTYIIRARTWGPLTGAYILTITGDFIIGDSATCAPVPLPAGSVVGTFITEAVADWSPGKQTEPPVTFAAGKTAWVTGVDASASYYQIAYGCDCLWVPVEAMGPNYDAVWNGTPLPTRTAGACAKPAFSAPAAPSPVAPPPQPTPSLT